MEAVITKKSIVQALSSLIRPYTKLLVVHSSLGTLGNLVNPQLMILEALDEAIPAGCTLAIPTFTFSFCQSKKFDLLHSPSEVGVLGDAFRKMPGVTRTPHPIYSFAVRGPLSKQFVMCKGRSCWGNGSVFELLEKENADIIMLGCGLEFCTLFHRIEELKEAPYRYRKTFSGEVISGETRTNTEVDMWVRRLDVSVQNDFQPLIEELMNQGIVRSVQVGRGVAKAVEAKEVMRIGMDLLNKDELAILNKPEVFLKSAKQSRIAILGSTNLDVFLSYFCKVFEKNTGEDCKLYVPPFNQYRQEIISKESKFYEFDPQWLIFLERVEDILGELVFTVFTNSLTDKSLQVEVEARVGAYAEIIALACEHTKAKALVVNFDIPEGSPFFLSASSHLSHQSSIYKFANDYLQKQLAKIPDAYCINYQEIRKNFGRSSTMDEKYWFIGKIPFSKAFSTYLSSHLVAALMALLGKTARLIILDLDNTLWGGVVGDDGLEGIQLGGDFPGNAYVNFQKTLMVLSKRGIALGICSKNTEEVALAAIDKHPNMLLRSDQFVVRRINWMDKAANIVEMAKEMSLGLSSICFIDDSPLERQLIRQQLPEVIVPELPPDPAKYSSFISELPCLMTFQLTKEDLGRVEKYKVRREVELIKKQSKSLEDFYRSMGMTLYIETYSQNTQARTLQLLAKTNQFNTTTKRYSAADLQRLQAEGVWIHPIGLKDRLSEKEIIGLIIVSWPKTQKDSAIIDSLLLSCRVIGRSVENAVLGWVSSKAKERKVNILQGLVLPTERNLPVRDVFTRNGFIHKDEHLFELDLLSNDLTIPNWFKVEEV